MKFVLLFVLISVLGPLSDAARILGMFSIFGKSHHRMFQPVMRTLAEAGHEVVVYSPFPLQSPPYNYTNVFLENISVDDAGRRDFFKRIADYPHWKSIDASWEIYEGLYHEWIGDKEVNKLLTSGQKFDLIMVETLAQEYSLVLGHVFKAPVISLQAFYTNNLANRYAGNTLSISFIPDLGNPFSDRMSFFQRVYNSLSTWRTLFLYYNVHIPRLDSVMRARFPDMPPLVDMTSNISMVFVNDHLTVDYAQPRPPSMIPVAGIHIGPPTPLPQEIMKFMDEATDGVIFFSLGTYVQDEIKPKEYFDMYNNIFKKLKQRVLWKTRKENIEDLPPNVMTLTWAPQDGVLAHPNCVLFITHGGLFSQHETIHYGVPVIGIPQFFDQHRNVKFYEARGVGVKLENHEISEESMSAAIDKVLHDPSYRDNMKRLSAVFRDRPLSPAESVVFWTEYVLRHGGAAHLRPASTELRWYQLVLLDVLALILVILILLSVSLYLILRKIIYCIYRKRFVAFCNGNDIGLGKKIN